MPQVEEVTVTAVRPDGEGFHVETDTGEQIAARTVVLAVGVLPFANRPWPLLELPRNSPRTAATTAICAAS
ncbi:hypothetical protein Srufu_050000 [Streptomyces libani subsp. rufus]|nr:hypothetical protein Srufu_050000 [Streptomyces libani subsp. rufus]